MLEPDRDDPCEYDKELWEFTELPEWAVGKVTRGSALEREILKYSNFCTLFGRTKAVLGLTIISKIIYNHVVATVMQGCLLVNG